MAAKLMTGPGGRARRGRPSPESRLTSKVVAVRLAPGVRVALDDLAERWGLSRSAAVARLVAEAAGQPPEEGAPSA